MNIKLLIIVAAIFTSNLIMAQSDRPSDSTIDKREFKRADREKREKPFEVVYPVTVSFADGSSKIIQNEDEMRTARKSWKQDNPDGKRPFIMFPYDIKMKDGSTKTIASADDLDANRKEFKRKRNGGKKNFTFNFPIEVKKADGTVVAVQDKKELREVMPRGERRGKVQSAETRPEFVFPISVTMADGTTRTFQSKKELKALRKSNKGSKNKKRERRELKKADAQE